MSSSAVQNSPTSALKSTNYNCTAWMVCLSAGLFFFYAFLQLNLFDVINEPLRQSFNADAKQLSFMSSTYLWADILFLIPAGILLDKFSTRLVVLIAMAFCVLGTIGFAVTESFILACIYHAISGASNAFCFLACVILVSRWFPPRRQAFVIGCLVTMAFVGGMVAHTPLAYLNNHFGWRNALLIDAAIGGVLFFWLYFAIKDRPSVSVNDAQHENMPKASFSKVFFNRQNILPGIYTACLNLPILVLCALWGGSYLQIVYKLSNLTASNIVSLILLGSVVGSPLAGWISDSWGKRKPIMILGAIATFLLIIPMFTSITLSVTSLSILFFCWGLFTSTQVIVYPMISESNSLANTGLATSIASIIIMGGGALAQMVFGMLLQYHAGAGNSNFVAADLQFAMWMFPVTTVLALIAILFTHETYCKRDS